LSHDTEESPVKVAEPLLYAVPLEVKNYKGYTTQRAYAVVNPWESGPDERATLFTFTHGPHVAFQCVYYGHDPVESLTSGETMDFIERHAPGLLQEESDVASNFEDHELKAMAADGTGYPDFTYTECGYLTSGEWGMCDLTLTAANSQLVLLVEVK
jgi:hypothetical protein